MTDVVEELADVALRDEQFLALVALAPAAQRPDGALVRELAALAERIAAPARLQHRLEPVAEIRNRAGEKDGVRRIVED